MNWCSEVVTTITYTSYIYAKYKHNSCTVIHSEIIMKRMLTNTITFLFTQVMQLFLDIAFGSMITYIHTCSCSIKTCK